MSLNKILKDAIQTHVPVVWIDAADSLGIEYELQRLAPELPATLLTWDLVRGVAIPQFPYPCVGDPVAAAGLGSQYRIAERPTVLLLHNYHWYLGRTEVVQALLNAIGNARAIPTTIVIAAPRIPLPRELETHLRFVEPGLPSVEEIRDIAEPLLSSVDCPCQRTVLLEALTGLTNAEVREIAHRACIASAQDPLQAVLSRKAELFERKTLLRQERSPDMLHSISGMSYLKEHCVKTLTSGYPAASRGLFLLGPGGCGKTAFAIALGNEMSRPVYAIDWSRLEEEAAVLDKELRNSLTRLEAMAPAILLLDEISTQIVRLGSVLDGNRLTKIWGVLVEWMTVHQADVFTIATGNAVGNVPLELLHADRLDAMFFVDLPDDEVRKALWEMFRSEFEILPNDTAPDSRDWTGGEIRACCRRAAHQGCSLLQAAASIVPWSVVSMEQLEALRLWASNRSRSVEGLGMYQHLPQWVNRRFIDPSMN